MHDQLGSNSLHVDIMILLMLQSPYGVTTYTAAPASEAALEAAALDPADLGLA